MCNSCETPILPYNAPTEPKAGEWVAKIVNITERPVNKPHGGRAGHRGVVYIRQKGESIADNIVYRRFRPYTVWKKSVLPLLVEKYPALAKYKFSWCQRAGCFCPCSPGFIVMPKKGEWGWWSTDLHVEIVWERAS